MNENLKYEDLDECVLVPRPLVEDILEHKLNQRAASELRVAYLMSRPTRVAALARTRDKQIRDALGLSLAREAAIRHYCEDSDPDYVETFRERVLDILDGEYDDQYPGWDVPGPPVAIEAVAEEPEAKSTVELPNGLIRSLHAEPILSPYHRRVLSSLIQRMEGEA